MISWNWSSRMPAGKGKDWNRLGRSAWEMAGWTSVILTMGWSSSASSSRRTRTRNSASCRSKTALVRVLARVWTPAAAASARWARFRGLVVLAASRPRRRMKLRNSSKSYKNRKLCMKNRFTTGSWNSSSSACASAASSTISSSSRTLKRKSRRRFSRRKRGCNNNSLGGAIPAAAPRTKLRAEGKAIPMLTTVMRIMATRITSLCPSAASASPASGNSTARIKARARWRARIL